MTVHAGLRLASRMALVGVLAACGSSDIGGQRTPGPGSPSASYSWAQDCGVQYYKHLPHGSRAADDHAYEAEEYVDLSLEAATDRARAAGLTIRVLGTDGDCEDRTDDLQARRVNFYVEDGIVRAAARF